MIQVKPQPFTYTNNHNYNQIEQQLQQNYHQY